MRHRLCPVGQILALSLAASAAWSEPAVDTLLIPEVAVIYRMPGTEFLEDVPDDASQTTMLGRLLEGRIQVAAVAPVAIDASSHRLTWNAGVVQIEVMNTNLDLCVREGEVEVDGMETVQAGHCLVVNPSGRTRQTPMTSRQGEVSPTWRTVPPPRRTSIYRDEPGDMLDRLARSLRGSSGTGRGEGEGVETGGAAACLEGGGGGGEVSGPQGPDLPETEIDRSHHRLQLNMDLEGY